MYDAVAPESLAAKQQLLPIIWKSKYHRNIISGENKEVCYILTENYQYSESDASNFQFNCWIVHRFRRN
jgi:hypothetical protein